MDKEAAKAAIREEMARRVTFSAGPEVFRRFLRSTADTVESALRELVAEGFLKQTELRVGTVYAYPANEKASHRYLAEQLARLAAAPAAPARPTRAAAHAAPAAAPRAVAPPPAATPAAPAPAEAAAPAPAATGPVRAKKRSEMTAEELAAFLAERGARDAGASAVVTGAPAAAAPAGSAAGPVRARKKSEMTPEELAELAARRAARTAGAADAEAAPPAAAAEASSTVTADATAPAGYSGPVRAKKKSQMTPEELAAEKQQ